jgi:hypothetical protein
MSYYKLVDGKKMDGHLLDIATNAVEGKGDGRISKEDSESLLKAVTDGGVYTDVEKVTMDHIRTNFQWTEGADEWFRTQIAAWAGSK